MPGDLDETLHEVGTQISRIRVTRKKQIEVGSRTNDADAASATTVGTLEHHRITGRLNKRLNFLTRRHRLRHPRHRGDTAGLSNATRIDLVA